MGFTCQKWQLKLVLQIMNDILLNLLLFKSFLMGSITRTIGRVLFVTILVSSAYYHLNKPDSSVKQFTQNYEHLLEHTQAHLPGVLPSSSTINWLLWVKIFGLFEALIAMLIVFGDQLGGLLLFVSLLVSGVFDYGCHISGILQWEVNKQLEFARYLFFVGAALTMISCKGGKSSVCKK